VHSSVTGLAVVDAAPARPIVARVPIDMVAVALLTIGCIASAMLTKHVVAVAGAVALLCFMVTTFLCRRSAPPLAGQVVPLALATTIIAVSRGGVTDLASEATSWRPLVALLAYPFLGRGVLRLVGRCRQLREVDVIVEGALVGLAAGIVVQVFVGDWGGVDPTASAWHDAQSALPSVLVGLAVAVLVVGARALGSPLARRGPLGLVLASTACLFGTHATQAMDATQGTDTITATLAAIAVAGLGLAALHPAARAEPDLVAEEPPLFSTSHAGVVVTALVAAPVVLAVQAVRQVTATATVATGAVLSGAVLACYLVSLLQERAATEHRATHDGLTGLPNRTLYADRLERALAHARRTDKPVAVLFIDLDRFKDVNDTFGHAAGDVLLTAVAQRLVRCCRSEDTVARLAGDEFAILLPHMTASSDAIVVAQRVLDLLADPVTVAGERVRVGGSVGIAVYPEDGTTTDELLASADAAMYRAKETGGNGYELFNPQLSTQAHERLRLESALYDGMARNELVLHYQPIIDAKTGTIVSAEALVRWDHPEHGLLLPGSFVPVAERSDLVVLLGEQVILDACRELRRWEDLGLGDRSIAVNVSARHFSHGLASTVASALRTTGANPKQLVIELTESTAADNLGLVVSTLEELRELGVRSAIDDFGTGYCGLRYLGSLPVDALKIDKSFVQGMTPSDAAIVAATIAMGHSLGLSIVAEGVETEDQRRFLEAQGCDRIQGYLIGRPMPAADLVDMMRVDLPPMKGLDAPVEPRLRDEVATHT
jgi:diguanylate cyclase (GGDEF)-like protein